MGPPSATLRKNGPDEVARAIKPLECVIFDCDGVIWRGQKKIEGAREAIAGLEAEGKRVLYLTNNSAKSREQCASKLRNFGIEANPVSLLLLLAPVLLLASDLALLLKSQVVCSSSSAARYLDSVRFDKAKKVLVIGQEGILIELAEAGYECVTCEDLCGSSDPECKIEEYEHMEVDPGVGAVVAGVDDTFSYRKLCIASLYLSSRESNAIFVATNLDVGDRVGSDGRLIPGAGPCLAAIQTASGREATNVGKGGEWLLPHLVETLNLDAQRTCIVSDSTPNPDHSTHTHTHTHLLSLSRGVLLTRHADDSLLCIFRWETDWTRTSRSESRAGCSPFYPSPASLRRRTSRAAPRARGRTWWWNPLRRSCAAVGRRQPKDEYQGVPRVL